ncbi:MAG: oligosaccharide flippase family protein [Candidatus Omnitrophota bacterium]
MGTIQIVVAKYISEFSGRNEREKIKFFISRILSICLVISGLTFFIFYFSSLPLLSKLKIPSLVSGPILAILLAVSCLAPVLQGALQGLESFKWLTSVSVASGVLKLFLAALFIWLGFSIAGALGALMISSLLVLLICLYPLRNFIFAKKITGYINYREILFYIFPVMLTSFCFIALVNMDMILVKYYFSEQNSGIYSLAQMVGKIFLFLPAAISVVLFPRASALNAKNADTAQTLKKSLIYGALLCLSALIFYNIFPIFTLKVLTGKVNSESIVLGRLFSFSMSFFTLSFILITYALSIKNFRFLKYLIASFIAQLLAIILLHQNLFGVQIILCINSVLLFLVLLRRMAKK